MGGRGSAGMVVSEEQLQGRRGQGGGGRRPQRGTAWPGGGRAGVMVAMVVVDERQVVRRCRHRRPLFQVEPSWRDWRAGADWVLCDVHDHGRGVLGPAR